MNRPINLIELTGIGFLNIRVHEEDGETSVYFEPSSEQIPNIQPGDLVLIRARVHESRVKGGYERSNYESVKARLGFSLDVGDLELIEIHRAKKRP